MRSMSSGSHLKFMFVITILAIPALLITAALIIYFAFPEVMYNIAVKAELNRARLTQDTITVDSLKYVYLEGGSGETIVAVHGFGADRASWVRMATHLTGEYRVVAPDLIGFGESSRPKGIDYTCPAQAMRVHRFIEALGIERFHLVGSSMGGCIAGHYAAFYPERLLSVCLISPSGVESAMESELDTILDRGEHVPLIPRTAQEYDELLAFVFHKRPFIPRPLYKVFARGLTRRAEFNYAIFETLCIPLEKPLEILLDSLEIPALVVWGEKDRVLHVSGAEILGDAIPNAQVDIMEDVGHNVMIEKPEMFARLYKNFLRGTNE